MKLDAVDMGVRGRPVRVDFVYEAHGRIHFETEGGGDYSFNADALQKVVKFVRRRDRETAK